MLLLSCPSKCHCCFCSLPASLRVSYSQSSLLRTGSEKINVLETGSSQQVSASSFTCLPVFPLLLSYMAPGHKPRAGSPSQTQKKGTHLTGRGYLTGSFAVRKELVQLSPHHRGNPTRGPALSRSTQLKCPEWETAPPCPTAASQGPQPSGPQQGVSFCFLAIPPITISAPASSHCQAPFGLPLFYRLVFTRQHNTSMGMRLHPKTRSGTVKWCSTQMDGCPSTLWCVTIG